MSRRPQPSHPAVVLGLTPTGLAAVRSLRRAGAEVWGVDGKAYELGHHSSQVRTAPFGFLPPGDQLASRLASLDTGMVVQKTIPGPESSIFVAGCYVGREGRVFALMTARKTRQFPPFFGSGSYMESEWNEEVARLSIDFLERLGYAGVCGTEYKPDPRDAGRYKLIEVNPRTTLWFSLTRAAGNDIVYHAYRDLTGDPLPPAVGRQRDGVRWQYLARDILTVAQYLPRGMIGPRDALRFVDPRKEYAVLSLRDLRVSAYYPLYLWRQWRIHRKGGAAG